MRKLLLYVLLCGTTLLPLASARADDDATNVRMLSCEL